MHDRLHSILCGAVLSILPFAAKAGIISHESTFHFGFITHLASLEPGTFSYRGEIGQTFRAIDTNLISIAIGLMSEKTLSGEPITDPVTITLYQGAGFGGPVLGEHSAVPTVTGILGDRYALNPIAFPVSGLVIGETYTYRVSGISDEVLLTFGGNNDFPNAFPNATYADGTAIFDGAFQPDYDLDFIIVGETPATEIPAPASLALFGVALAGLGLAMRPRR